MKGFSLIELLIIVSIVGILTTISLPLYSQHVVNERRTEAKTTLIQLAASLEEYDTIHHTYQGASLQVLNFPEIIAHDSYKLSIIDLSDSAFTIAAEPLSHHDTCGTLTLNALGEKAISGTGQITDCW